MEHGTKGLAYEYPLRPDFIAQLVLPSDLTALEQQRLTAFLRSLVADERAAEGGEQPRDAADA